MIEKNDVYAVARVRPKFQQRVTGSYTQVWNLPFIKILNPSLFGSVTASDDKRWGYEVGLTSDYLSLSFLNEVPFAASDKSYSSTEASYHDELFLLDAQFPFSVFAMHGGFDIFAGEDNTQNLLNLIDSEFPFPTTSAGRQSFS